MISVGLSISGVGDKPGLPPQ